MKPSTEKERSDNENRNPNEAHHSEFWNPIVKVVGWALLSLFVTWQFCIATIDKDHQWGIFLQIAPNVLIIIAMGYHAYIYNRQWQAMKKSIERTDKIIEQDRQTFYWANRAYVGATAAFIEPEGVTKVEFSQETYDIPDNARFRLVIGVQNSGNTPASNFGHVFRIGIILNPVTEEPPPFGPISQSRTMPQISPNNTDHAQYFRGTWLQFPETPIKDLKSGEATLVVSCKFVFDTLGESEEEVVHFVWIPDDRSFTVRRDYPFAHADDAITVYKETKQNPN
jgi:hypothetical protein